MERVLKSKYKIQQTIVESPWSGTYKGQVLDSGELVAIKIYRRSHLDNFLIQKLSDKAKNLSLLTDPHIARLLDGDYGWQGFFFVREYVEGQNLAEFLQSRKVLDIDQILSLTSSLCGALQAAHEKGVVHGNLNPYNVIITSEGFPKITDFGIDRSIRSSFYQKVQQLLHNPLYLSPEQIKGIPSNQTSDVYNVGVLLYFMLTGTLPYKNGSALQIALKKLKEVPTPPTALNPKTPSYLEEITLKALEIDPLLRFESALEMKKCLNEKAILVRTSELGLSSPRYAELQMGNYEKTPEELPNKRFHLRFPQAPDSDFKKKMIYLSLLLCGAFAALLLGYSFIRMILR